VITIEYLIPEILEEAWHIFRTYFDHDFSFTDCTSFRLMERLRIDTVFTFDKNFRKYGRFIVKP
jgi:predicted nucleic acid-binding protein